MTWESSHTFYFGVSLDCFRSKHIRSQLSHFAIWKKLQFSLLGEDLWIRRGIRPQKKPPRWNTGYNYDILYCRQKPKHSNSKKLIFGKIERFSGKSKKHFSSFPNREMCTRYWSDCKSRTWILVSSFYYRFVSTFVR